MQPSSQFMPYPRPINLCQAVCLSCLCQHMSGCPDSRQKHMFLISKNNTLLIKIPATSSCQTCACLFAYPPSAFPLIFRFPPGKGSWWAVSTAKKQPGTIQKGCVYVEGVITWYIIDQTAHLFFVIFAIGGCPRSGSMVTLWAVAMVINRKLCQAT